MVKGIMEPIELALARAEYFKHDTKYYHHIKTAKLFYDKGYINEALEELNKLPSDKDLFDELVSKLGKKSAFKRFKEVALGKKVSKDDYLLAHSSLLTHILLEKQKRPEYSLLVEPTLSKIYQLI